MPPTRQALARGRDVLPGQESPLSRRGRRPRRPPRRPRAASSAASIAASRARSALAARLLRVGEPPLELGSSIVVNAIIAWNTFYIQRVIDELLAAGELITTSEIEHISPLAHQHIHLYGHYPFNLVTRPAGHRPLRAPAVAPAPAPKTPNRV